MKVGYYRSNYPSKRNIIDAVPCIHYVKLHDINEAVQYMFIRANKALRRPIFNTIDVDFIFNDLDLNRVDLIHVFNTISFGTTPWVTTFETIVPRFKSTLSCHHGPYCDFSSLIHESKILHALDALSSDSCKKLIAMSECNLNMQTEFLRHFPQHRPEIERKLVCLHPPQPLLVHEYASKRVPLDGQIRFLFVGGAFFRKGGIEILESFQEARRNNGYDLKLTIVSSLLIDNYATKETKEDVERAKKLISENGDWIEFRGHLGNLQVIELMKASHIGLLPTYADTYGFSVLEFQAAGCPVISTNVRALPEINNNERGWVIEIPKNRLGEAIYTTEEDRIEIGRTIRKGLAGAITEIMNNSQLIFRKANASLMYIRDNHSPEVFARRLGEIYHCALKCSNSRCSHKNPDSSDT